MTAPAYAELEALSNFSFLQGASHPEELVETAAALGCRAFGLADINTLAGVVRAHMAAKAAGLAFLPGARLDLRDDFSFLAYPIDRKGYGRLCRLLALGKNRAEKGACDLTLCDLEDWAAGLVLIARTPARIDDAFADRLGMARNRLPGPLYLAANPRLDGADRRRIARLAGLADAVGVSLVAAGGALYHHPARRPLQDVLTCIREKVRIEEAGLRLESNAERHLKAPADMARLFHGFERALARTAEIAEACRFSLDELRYEYPDEPVPPGKTPQQHLTDLAWAGAARRYPGGVSDAVKATIAKELDLIQQLDYAPYFLTIHDIVRFAESREILCQGRGSAANSAVCFCLGITAVDPSEHDLLFERFISEERKEPPDIDVDFEHERREEVIQYIYGRYGRHRAAIAATVIHYRPRMAVREVGKVMGLSEDATGALAGTVWGSWGKGLEENRIRESGLDPTDPRLRQTLDLARELLGFPRHLSQHVGGFILTRDRLDETVPIGPAAMADRHFVEWDKDDLDALGLMKVDVLALGMLTCLRKGFDLLKAHKGLNLSLATTPKEDAATYAMIQKADTVGVFQIESRAQMNMLPRLKPKEFYDLVIEVAIVRPGPIQGDMVHPYLRRRDGLEREDYPAPSPEHGPPDELKRVLGKTLGVPLFQEQAMRIAIEAAKFTPSEANQLRRAMATFRKVGTIHKFQEKMVEGMAARGYDRDFAERCFRQIEGFGEYGFPESHAASFAKLVYVSCWMKRRHPEAFACALLNSQPMGFYAPAQIVRDARDHDVEVRPVDVNSSDWDCTLEPDGSGGLALRLGLRLVDGLGEGPGHALAAARGPGYLSVEEIRDRTGLPPAVLEKLARADAFGSLGLDRRGALWAARAVKTIAPLPLFEAVAARARGPEDDPALPPAPLGEAVVEDYRALRLSLKAHPMEILRGRFADSWTTAELRDAPHGRRGAVAGVVLVRQKPGSAKGVVFVTLEDETGVANLVVWPKVLERFRPIVMGARLLRVTGEVQRQGAVVHLVAARLEDRTRDLLSLAPEAAFPALAHADEVARPQEDRRPPPARHPREMRILPKSRDFH